MSFSRLSYDPCAYKTNLKQSLGPGNYFTGQPRLDCQVCFPEDTHFMMGQSHIGPVQNGIGGSTCKDTLLIDTSSELLGLNRPTTKCPSEKYQKKNVPHCNLLPPQTCQYVKTEDTRLSNPPCNLAGTGWNRWEWLCKNPQENVTTPFDHNICSRILAKDNHRPLIPTPISPVPTLPPWNNSDEMYKSPWMSCTSRPGDIHIPSTSWKHCDSIY